MELLPYVPYDTNSLWNIALWMVPYETFLMFPYEIVLLMVHILYVILMNYHLMDSCLMNDSLMLSL